MLAQQSPPQSLFVGSLTCKLGLGVHSYNASLNREGTWRELKNENWISEAIATLLCLSENSVSLQLPPPVRRLHMASTSMFQKSLTENYHGCQDWVPKEVWEGNIWQSQLNQLDCRPVTQFCLQIKSTWKLEDILMTWPYPRAVISEFCGYPSITFKKKTL